MRSLSMFFISLAAAFVFATPANATPEEAYQACTQGNLDGCRFAVEHSRGRDYELYRKALSNGCMMGDRMSCGEGHFAFKDKRAPIYDAEQAGKFAQVGCQNGFADMCFHAGKFFKGGEWRGGASATEDQIRSAHSNAEMAYTLACESLPDGQFFKAQDRQTACHSLFNGFDYPITSFKAQYANMNGCEAGLDWMCRNAAINFLEGRGEIPPVLESAIKYYEIGCDLGDQNSCARRGAIAYFQEDNPEKALSFAGPACLTGSDKYGCELASAVGFYADAPQGVNKSDIYAKACEMLVVEGCDALADDANLRGDVPGMKLYARQSCDLGSDYGCNMLTLIADAEAVAKADHQALIAQLDSEWKARMAANNAKKVERKLTLAQATYEYWNNWKPSYCADYTRAGFTTKVECVG